MNLKDNASRLKVRNVFNINFILLITLAIIVSLICLNFYSIYKGGKELNSEIKAYKKNALRKQSLLNEVINLNSKVKNVLLLHLVTDDDKLMSIYEKEYEALAKITETKHHELEGLATSEQEKSIIYNLNRFKARYIGQRKSFISLSKHHNKFEAKSLYGHSMFYSFSLFRLQLEHLKDYADRSSAVYYDTLNGKIAESYASIKKISAFGLLFVIALVFVAIVTINKLNRNNSNLAKLLQEKESAEKRIRLLNEELEQKVIERTRDLEWAHTELRQQVMVLNHAAIVSEAEANGNIMFVNEMFCKVSGYTKEEVIGRNHRILKSGKQPSELFIQMWDTLQKGMVWKGEIINKNKEGKNYWLSSTIMPFKNSEGVIIKYLSVCFDITKQKEQQNLLQSQTDALSVKSEQLRVQQQELYRTNSILEAQTQKLIASEEELKMQHEELQASNQELEEKSQMLEEGNALVKLKNDELEIIANELKKKAEELSLSNKYKSEFLANMSHELRTPLNSILLLSKLLSDNYEGNLTKDQVEYAQVINNSGNGLLELINEILDLSKIEAGKMDAHKEYIPISYLCKNAYSIFKPIAQNKNIGYSYTIEESVPENVFTDRIKVEQVLKNLISNALKFTEQGEVKVRVFVPNADMIKDTGLENIDYVAFEVTDTGIGIPEDKLDHIFEAFQQADGSTRRKYGGTGLGLSISKQISKLLNGKIILNSYVGEGSVFTFIIPATENNNHEKALKPNPSTVFSNYHDLQPPKLNADNYKISTEDEKTIYDSNNVLEGKSILIVDDDNRNIFSIKKLLERQRMNITTAVNGKEALSNMKTNPNFDLVIMDMMMPEMDGYETVKELRKSDTWKKLPIIALTAKVMKGDKDKCIEAGASDYMTKPVIGEELLSLLKVWLNK